MSKNLVVKDNALINASYNLELVEQRLILLAIVEARASGKGINPNDSLAINAGSYMNHFETNRNTAYQALKDACNNLFERQFSFIEKTDKGDKIVRTRWVSRVAYIENLATVELIFAPDVAPLITLLEKNFTSYDLEQVAGLNSKYAVRLYEIVLAWHSAGKTPMIKIDELRERLGVPDNEYPITADFKRWTLDKPIKQINEKTNITLSYEQHKQGRKIIGFTFTIKQKTKSKKFKVKDEKINESIFDIFDKLTDQERQIIAQKKEYAHQKGITDPAHIDNLINQAMDKHHKALQKDKAKQEQEKVKKQAELKKKQAQQKAQAKKEEQENLQRKQKIDEAITKFESLTFDDQQIVLDSVSKKLAGPFVRTFNDLREKNTAHKDIRFIIFFEMALSDHNFF